MTTDSQSTPTAATTAPRQTTPDDLLSMYDEETKGKTDEVKKEVEKQARVQQELPKKLVADKLVKSLDSKPIPQEGGEEDYESEEGSQEKSGEEGSEKESQEVKAIKAKLGDEEVSIPEEAEITQKIGNKQVTFKVADAVKAFVGQEEFNRNMDRRVQSVTSRERRFDEGYKEMTEKASRLVKLAQSGEWMPVVKVLAKMASRNGKIDPVEVEKKVLENLDKVQDLYSKMTPQEREVYFAQRRAEAAEDETRELRSHTQRTEAERAIEHEVKSLCSQEGITEDRFFELYGTLAEKAVGEGKRFASPEEIQPQHVREFHKDCEHYAKIDQAVSRVSEALLDDEVFCEEVFELTRTHPEFTEEDIEQIVRDALSANSQSIENLNRKVQKASTDSLRTQLNQGNSGRQEANSEEDDELEEFFFKSNKRQAQLARLMRR